MTLSHDTARCSGYTHFGVPAVPCRTCQRRAETVHGERQSWMRPPPVIGIECASRIAPEGEKNVD